jgi:hypothetical protein
MNARIVVEQIKHKFGESYSLIDWDEKAIVSDHGSRLVSGVAPIPPMSIRQLDLSSFPIEQIIVETEHGWERLDVYIESLKKKIQFAESML